MIYLDRKNEENKEEERVEEVIPNRGIVRKGKRWEKRKEI